MKLTPSQIATGRDAVRRTAEGGFATAAKILDRMVRVAAITKLHWGEVGPAGDTVYIQHRRMGGTTVSKALARALIRITEQRVPFQLVGGLKYGLFIKSKGFFKFDIYDSTGTRTTAFGMDGHEPDDFAIALRKAIAALPKPFTAGSRTDDNLRSVFG